MVELDEIIVTKERLRRDSRTPNYEGENRALRILATEMQSPTGDVLAKLSEIALELCGAHSAGISLIENNSGAAAFRWHAVAGRWAAHVGGGMPRNASPCGVVIDRNATLLMQHPGNFFSR